MKKINFNGGYVAPEMTLFATPVEQGFFNTYGDKGEAGSDFGSSDPENNYGEF